jgi:hypothetical protein
MIRPPRRSSCRCRRAQLTEPAQFELQFLSDTERSQYERNQDALRARLDRIPSEIERETAAIKTRNADPSPRLFPVAVASLIPRALR